ncbi:MAG: hypothetical protein JEY99_20995 [Spirochaetales bacterium]|nr:hypothetical protein [Spirochaetales bacterium]
MFKKITMILLLILLLVPSVSLFSYEPPKKNAVSFDPISALFNLWSVSYERGFTDLISVKGAVTYSPNFFWVSEISYLDVQAEGRYYFGAHLKDVAEELPIGQEITGKLFANAINGLYAGVFLGGVTAKANDYVSGVTTYDATFFGLGGGVNVGVKYAIWGDSFSLFAEPFLGYRLYFPVGGLGGWSYKDSDGVTINEKPDGFDDGFNRTGFNFGVNFGLSF